MDAVQLQVTSILWSAREHFPWELEQYAYLRQHPLLFAISAHHEFGFMVTVNQIQPDGNVELFSLVPYKLKKFVFGGAPDNRLRLLNMRGPHVHCNPQDFRLWFRRVFVAVEFVLTWAGHGALNVTLPTEPPMTFHRAGD